MNPRKFLAADTLRAYEDLSSRTLAAIPSALERLIYIASTRDYNSGLYHHEGLVARFGVSAAAQALESAHRESFHEVSLMPLRDLSNELEKYMKSSREESRAFWTDKVLPGARARFFECLAESGAVSGRNSHASGFHHRRIVHVQRQDRFGNFAPSSCGGS